MIQLQIKFCQRLHKAIERRTRKTSANLSNAGFTVRDAGVDDRLNAGVDDFSKIDSARRATEIQCRQLKRVRLTKRNMPHALRIGSRVIWRATVTAIIKIPIE